MSELLIENPGRHTLRVIAATGRGILQQHQDGLLRNNKDPLEVELQVIDHRETILGLPDHWKSDVLTSIAELQEKCRAAKISLTVRAYHHVPLTFGVLIDNNHLLMALPVWDEHKERLADAGEQYTYFKRSGLNSRYFTWFQNQLAHGPQRDWSP